METKQNADGRTDQEGRDSGRGIECPVCASDNVDLIDHILASGTTLDGQKCTITKLGQIFGFKRTQLKKHENHSFEAIQDIKDGLKALQERVTQLSAREMGTKVFVTAHKRMEEIAEAGGDIVPAGKLALEASELIAKISGEVEEKSKEGASGGGQVIFVMPTVFGKSEEEMKKVVGGSIGSNVIDIKEYENAERIPECSA